MLTSCIYTIPSTACSMTGSCRRCSNAVSMSNHSCPFFSRRAYARGPCNRRDRCFVIVGELSCDNNRVVPRTIWYRPLRSPGDITHRLTVGAHSATDQLARGGLASCTKYSMLCISAGVAGSSMTPVCLTTAGSMSLLLALADRNRHGLHFSDAVNEHSLYGYSMIRRANRIPNTSTLGP